MNHFRWICPLMQTIANHAYDFKIEGQEHIPQSGGVIVACNHVTYLDWVFLMAALAPRPLRFLIDENFTEAPIFKTVIGFSNPIPVCVDTVKPRSLKISMKRVIDALKSGDAVGMFPEGMVTRSGKLNEFKPGIEIFARQANVPVLPATLNGLWGSIWSWSDGRVLLKRPKNFKKMPVQLKFYPPLLPHEVSSCLLHEKILKATS